MEISKPLELRDCVFLSARDINGKIEDTLLKKIKKDVEGKCVKAGFVIPDSVKIVSRSLGAINNANFTSVITYNVIYHALVCNPGVGAELACYVASIDKSQIVCYIDGVDISPLEIYLYKNHHVGNVDFVNLKVGDKIIAKLLASKFNFGDTQIIAIAQFLHSK
jgi:DNA-directed RNA polymerase subunit E'/Rpb7